MEWRIFAVRTAVAGCNSCIFVDKFSILQLSETATKLLYRDRRSRLSLIDLDSDRKTTLLSYCTYVQWVPKSDVIVAQSGEQLCVWYQADNPEQVGFHLNCRNDTTPKLFIHINSGQ